MRVALLSHLASTQAPTGAEHSLALLACGLARRGHDVHVAAPGRWALAPELEAAGVRVTEIPVRMCWLVQPEPQPALAQALRFVRWAVPDPGVGRLRRWLEDLAPDVVHVNCLPHLGGAAAARVAGLPVVWHVREILPPGVRRRAFARRLRRDADCVVAVSRAVASWLEMEGLGDRLGVVHNGVEVPRKLPVCEEARRELGLDPDATVAAWLGQLLPHKGALEAVEAVERARRTGPPLELVLAGSGSGRARARLAAALAARPWARLVPPQAGPWKVLAAADLVAVTPTAPDPLPRVVMEAMAAGRPVVAFASGGVPEMVEDGVTGVLVPAGDVAGLGAAMAELAADSDRRRSVGEAAGRRARAEFGLDRHVERMEAILRRHSYTDGPGRRTNGSDRSVRGQSR